MDIHKFTEGTVFLEPIETITEGSAGMVTMTLDLDGHTLDVEVTVTVSTALDTAATSPGV